MKIAATMALASVLCLACSRPRGYSRVGGPTMPSAHREFYPMPQDDWRRPLVGRWHVVFHVDQVASWQRRVRVGTQVNGTLIISDTLAADFPALGPKVWTDLDFRSAFGEQAPCFNPAYGIIAVRQSLQYLLIDFSPTCADFNLIARARYWGDSVSGTWTDVLGIGTESTRRGRFQMFRHVPGQRPN